MEVSNSITPHLDIFFDILNEWHTGYYMDALLILRRINPHCHVYGYDQACYVFDGIDFEATSRCIKYLKAFGCYNPDWSGRGPVDDLASLYANLKDNMRQLEDEVAAVLLLPVISNELKGPSKRIRELAKKINIAYWRLNKAPGGHPPLLDALVFDNFSASAHNYLLDVPNLLLYGLGSSHLFALNRKLEGYYNILAQKLERFRYLVSSFSKQCTNEGQKKKFISVLGRAGAVILSILETAFLENRYDNMDSYRHGLGELARQCSGIPRVLSPAHNPNVMEVYREVLEAYAQIIKASNSMVSQEEELLVESTFLNLLQSAQNQVHIMSHILDFPIMDLILDMDDHNEEVEILLKKGYAAVAREAGSLCSSVSKLVPSKLLQELNLVKAEIFVLELHTSQKADLTFSAENRVAMLKYAFKFLSGFLKTPAAYVKDTEKLIIAHIEAFLRETGSLCDSHQTKQFSEDMISESSLSIFKLFKAEAMVMVIVHNTSRLKFLAEFRIQTLHRSLIFLRAFVSDQAQNDNPKDANVSTVCEALASKAASLVFSFGDRNVEMNQPIEIHRLSSQLATLIELNIEDITTFYQQSPWSMFLKFPKNDGVVFLENLLERLRMFLCNKRHTPTLMNDQVEALLVEMEFMRSFLKDVIKEATKNKDLRFRVVCLIYDVEHIVEMFILGDIPVWYHQFTLLVATEETKFIKAQIQEIFHCKESFEQNLHEVESTSALQASNLRTEEVIVGFNDQAKIISQHLLNGSNSLQIVSMVGMGGIGKTTLAKKVYSSLSIQHHFTVRAQCYVSQVYQKRELLLDILGDIAEVTDDIGKMDDNDKLADIVRKKLKGQRYLILMDDIWRIETWNDLSNIFPDDKKGSRILFTTRVLDVALKTNSKIEPYIVPLLDKEQSWVLLEAKVFEGRGCPSELSELGRLIAESCKGLPLAIVVIAGILKGAELKKDQWEDIAEHLRSRIADGQLMDILEFSYNHLPSYLKPCYLYLGTFLEDQEIPARKLQRLWIAEGFIPKMDSKSFEETAEGYLVELLHRSLVMEAKRSSLGGTKTCQIHDMLRDLCLKKAREENFVQLISSNDTSNSEILIGMQYRLCVHSSNEKFIQSRPSGSNVHSLLFFSTNNTGYKKVHDVSFIFQHFKVLRVLDLESLSADYVSRQWNIDLMSGTLNYIAIKGDIKSVPSSISKLWNLETLIVKGTRGEVSLPSTLWTMATLSYVQVRPRASLTSSNHELGNALVLENLHTISSPFFSDKKVAQKILKRWKRVRNLRCIFLEQWDSFRKCNVFPSMEFLTQLESLNIHYIGESRFPCEFSFPQNLKKLTVSKFCLPWEYISVISGRLRNLEVLKLLFRAFEGDTWDMIEGEFPKLKYLKLENLNLANWNASGDPFPELERLVLKSCKKLGEVPSYFGEASTLQMIEVQRCSQSTANSLKTILELQKEYGNPDLKVFGISEGNFSPSS